MQINDGTITINASDDGINAATKAQSLSPAVIVNGGTVPVAMGQGDTDAIDCNGDLTINGGTLDITAQSAFDYDGKGTLNGGDITVNGSTVNALTQTGPGGAGGGRGGFQNGNGGFGGHGGHF